MMFTTLAPGAIGVRNISLQDGIDLAAKSGFAGLVFDIREAAALADANDVDHVRSLFADAGVRPSYWGLPVAYRREERIESDLAALPRFAALGRELGCTRTTSGISPGSDELSYAENFSWHVERLRPIAAVLAEAGCHLGFEFLGPRTLRAPYKHEFVYTLEGAMEVSRAIGTGNVGVLLDAWHLFTSSGTLDDLDSLTADDVVAVHVNDAPRGVPFDEVIDSVRALPLETGVLDLVAFMHKLRNLGYDGPVMPEPFSKRIDEIGATDPLAAAREAARSMNDLWRASGLV
jgi:sugar phosphate isomerase/epimerase